MKKLTIFTDGGSRNNPGPAGIGVVVYESDKIIETYKEYIGTATNNQAEYRALIKALELAEKYQAQAIDCFLDSELIVKQMNGQYKVKNEGVRELYHRVLELIVLKKVTFNHVRRENNKLADKLVNEALDKALK